MKGAGWANPPLENFSPPQEKFVGYILKLLDIVQKIWAPLRKLFAPPGVPGWLRAWVTVISLFLLYDNVLLMSVYGPNCSSMFGPFTTECLNSMWLRAGCVAEGDSYPSKMSVSERNRRWNGLTTLRSDLDVCLTLNG